MNNPALVVVVTLERSVAVWRRGRRPGLSRSRGDNAALPRCSARSAGRAGAEGPVTEEPAGRRSVACGDLECRSTAKNCKKRAVVGPELPPEMIPAGPKVPNFRGKTKRQVMEESSASAYRVEIAGAGIARGRSLPRLCSQTGRTSKGAVRAMKPALTSACLSPSRPTPLPVGARLFPSGKSIKQKDVPAF